MDTKLLFSVCFCLLGAGLMDAGITQKPRHLIVHAGKKTTLKCSQNMNHYSMFWYRQDPGQGPRLLHYSGSVGSSAEGEASQGFSVSRNETEHFLLTLETPSTSQSSLYLCASSEATAVHSQLLSAQEGQPQGSGGPSFQGPCLKQQPDLS
ncbi:T-cell receptor beta chain V region [Sciurus carolinensis]|nr:T-cell receptor beta chain V region [Sciurus carolinensis]